MKKSKKTLLGFSKFFLHWIVIFTIGFTAIIPVGIIGVSAAYNDNIITAGNIQAVTAISANTGAGRPAINVYDGNTTSYWQANENAGPTPENPIWLNVEFKSMQSFNKLEVVERTGVNGSTYEFRINKFNVQVSDGTDNNADGIPDTYTDIAAVDKEGYSAGGSAKNRSHVVSLNEVVTAKHLRINITECFNNSGKPGIAELYAWNTAALEAAAGSNYNVSLDTSSYTSGTIANVDPTTVGDFKSKLRLAAGSQLTGFDVYSSEAASTPMGSTEAVSTGNVVIATDGTKQVIYRIEVKGIQQFKVTEFNGGVIKGIETNGELTMQFSTNVNALNLYNKLSIRKGSDAGVLIPNAGIVQDGPQKIKIIGLSLEKGSTYYITVAPDAADDAGVVISGTTEFSFKTVTLPLNSYVDFEGMSAGAKPAAVSGFNWSESKADNLVTYIDGKNYLNPKAVGHDQNIGVLAPYSFNSYTNKILYNVRMQIKDGGDSGSQTRIRMNTNDTNQIQLVLFQDNKIGVLDYAGETKDKSGGEWVYKNDEFYDVSIVLDYTPVSFPKVSVYIVGDKGTNYSIKDLEMKAEDMTSSAGSTVTTEGINTANNIYIYSNSKTNGDELLIDHLGMSDVGDSVFDNVQFIDKIVNGQMKTDIVVNFTKPIKAGVTAAAVTPKVASDIRFNRISADNGRSMVFEADQRIYMDTEGYTLSLSGITDYNGNSITFADRTISPPTWDLFAKHIGFSQERFSSGPISANFTVKNLTGESRKVTVILLECVGTPDNYMVKNFAANEVEIQSGVTEQPISGSIEISDAPEPNSFLQAFVWDMESMEMVMFRPKLLQ